MSVPDDERRVNGANRATGGRAPDRAPGPVRRVSLWRPLLWVLVALIVVVLAERLGLFGG